MTAMDESCFDQNLISGLNDVIERQLSQITTSQEHTQRTASPIEEIPDQPALMEVEHRSSQTDIDRAVPTSIEVDRFVLEVLDDKQMLVEVKKRHTTNTRKKCNEVHYSIHKGATIVVVSRFVAELPVLTGSAPTLKTPRRRAALRAVEAELSDSERRARRITATASPPTTPARGESRASIVNRTNSPKPRKKGASKNPDRTNEDFENECINDQLHALNSCSNRPAGVQFTVAGHGGAHCVGCLDCTWYIYKPFRVMGAGARGGTEDQDNDITKAIHQHLKTHHCERKMEPRRMLVEDDLDGVAVGVLCALESVAARSTAAGVSNALLSSDHYEEGYRRRHEVPFMLR